MKQIKVLPGQSLFDIAVTEYGDVVGVTFLPEDNPELNGPTDRIYPGQLLNIRETPISFRTQDYLKSYPTIATIDEEDKPEGIGFWRLDEHVVQ